MFDGETLFADVDLTFDESTQEDGVVKKIVVDRKVVCKSCKGSRESTGSKSIPCNSCSSKGIKVDSLFNT